MENFNTHRERFAQPSPPPDSLSAQRVATCAKPSDAAVSAPIDLRAGPMGDEMGALQTHYQDCTRAHPASHRVHCTTEAIKAFMAPRAAWVGLLAAAAVGLSMFLASS